MHSVSSSVHVKGFKVLWCKMPNDILQRQSIFSSFATKREHACVSLLLDLHVDKSIVF